MSYDKYSYYVLCEDRAHFGFVYGYLMEMGAKRGKINTIIDFPEGKSDAKKFVQSNYGIAVEKMKQKSANTVLIVLRDADLDEHSTVLKFFDNSMNNVFIAVPKQNVETWFYFFANKDNAESKDETKDRKLWYRQHNEKPKPAFCGKQFVDVIKCKKNNQSIPNIPASLDATVSRIIEYEENL